jgi:hypothetical protein
MFVTRSLNDFVTASCSCCWPASGSSDSCDDELEVDLATGSSVLLSLTLEATSPSSFLLLMEDIEFMLNVLLQYGFVVRKIRVSAYRLSRLGAKIPSI